MRSRLVLVSTSYPREPGDPSGHFVEAEAAQWAERGAEVHVLAPGPRGEAQRAGVVLHGLGCERLFGFPGVLARAKARPERVVEAPVFVARARTTLSRLGPVDRVIAHFVVPSGWPVGLVGRAPLEVVGHGSDVRLLVALPRALRAAIVSSLVERGATFRFVAERLRSTLLGSLDASLAREVDAKARVEPSPFVVPDVASAASRARASLRLEAGERLFVTCARLVGNKRVDRAIEHAARERASLVVVGDGPERRPLEQLAARLGARAHFVGRVPRHDALAWIAAADKLVHYSEEEGAPTVVREARALGVPVLARPAGDVPRWAADDPGIELAG